MKFCPKCGTLMIPKKESGKTLLSCSCGYKDSDSEGAKLKEEIKEQKDVEVIDEDIETRPITDAECPKCGNNKAHYYLVQTRASDEPETKFLQCTECKHKWRDYS